MTGGVGFSGMGRQSFKDNRALRNKRVKMEENPFNKQTSLSKGAFDLNEIREHRLQKEKAAKTKNKIILTSAIIIVTMVTLLLWLHVF